MDNNSLFLALEIAMVVCYAYIMVFAFAIYVVFMSNTFRRKGK